METNVTAPSDREIELRRAFDAPRELVFAAYANAEYLARWWGPNGFTTTIQAFDFRVGGSWRFVMHGPDGTDWDNLVVYREIVAPEKLVFDHGAHEGDPNQFHVTITFEEEDGKTVVTQRSRFATAEACEAVKAFGAVELGQQTLARLAEHLKAL